MKKPKHWSCLRWCLNIGNVKAAASSGGVQSHEVSATVLMTGTAGVRGCACGPCARKYKCHQYSREAANTWIVDARDRSGILHVTIITLPCFQTFTRKDLKYHHSLFLGFGFCFFFFQMDNQLLSGVKVK